jgi:hypothetical protein
VLLFTGLPTLSVGVIVGLVPALRAASPRLGTGLRAGSHGVPAGRAHQRLRSGLIIARVALAVVLLFAAGLLLQTFAGLLGVDRGYDADEVLTLMTDLPTAAYPDFTSRVALYDEVLQRIDGSPNVESSALSTSLPLFPLGQRRSGLRGAAQVVLLEKRSCTVVFHSRSRIVMMPVRRRATGQIPSVRHPRSSRPLLRSPEGGDPSRYRTLKLNSPPDSRGQSPSSRLIHAVRDGSLRRGLRRFRKISEQDRRCRFI